MKAKTSITLSESILCDVDRAAGTDLSRSAFIERVLKQHFRDERRRERNAHDLEILNAIADGERDLEPPDAWEFGSDHFWASED